MHPGFTTGLQAEATTSRWRCNQGLRASCTLSLPLLASGSFMLLQLPQSKSGHYKPQLHCITENCQKMSKVIKKRAECCAVRNRGTLAALKSDVQDHAYSSQNPLVCWGFGSQLRSEHKVRTAGWDAVGGADVDVLVGLVCCHTSARHRISCTHEDQRETLRRASYLDSRVAGDGRGPSIGHRSESPKNESVSSFNMNELSSIQTNSDKAPALHVITGIAVNISLGLESSKEFDVISQRAPSRYMPDTYAPSLHWPSICFGSFLVTSVKTCNLSSSKP